MNKCPYCNQTISSFEALSDEITDDTVTITIRYTCRKCHKDFIGTTEGEITFWHPEEIEECSYYLG